MDSCIALERRGRGNAPRGRIGHAVLAVAVLVALWQCLARVPLPVPSGFVQALQSTTPRPRVKGRSSAKATAVAEAGCDVRVRGPKHDKVKEFVLESWGTPRLQLLWQEAASAAVDELEEKKAAATTITMPSGSGLILVGMRVVMEIAMKRPKPFGTLVILPRAHLEYAERLYKDFALPDMEVVNLHNQGDGKEVSPEKLVLLRKQAKGSLVILGSYETAGGIIFTQTEYKSKPYDLLVMEMAHLMRAGSYRDLPREKIQARQRLFISSRRLVGRAPGALLAPGQDPGYPQEGTTTEFGNQAFRLDHNDAYELGISVPVKIMLLDAIKVTRVAVQLAELNQRTGVKSFHLVGPSRPEFTDKLKEKMKVLTNGTCTISRAPLEEKQSLEAIILTSSSPKYVHIAEELARLMYPAPGKKFAYIILAASEKEQAHATWRALALENELVEEGLQDAAVTHGARNHDLLVKELPSPMAACMYEPQAELERAVRCANRAIRNLADPWDRWYGRLLAFKRESKRPVLHFFKHKPEYMFGYDMTEWYREQKRLMRLRLLSADKIMKLHRLGVPKQHYKERFNRGIAELREYVLQHRTRVVPVAYVTESGFDLGVFCKGLRKRQRRGKLNDRDRKRLEEAYFLWTGTDEQRASNMQHPEEFEAALVTREIEEELSHHRWKPRSERRKIFMGLVMKYHPDVSTERYSAEAIQFLSDIRDWFLVG